MNSDDYFFSSFLNYWRDKRKPEINLVDVNKKHFAATHTYVYLKHSENGELTTTPFFSE